MPEEQTTAAPATPEPPKVTTTPLSVSTFGRLNVVIFRHTEGDKSGIYLNIRVAGGGDPSAIPLEDVPALVMLLGELSRPAIQVRTFERPAPPAPPAPAKPSKKPKKK